MGPVAIVGTMVSVMLACGDEALSGPVGTFGRVSVIVAVMIAIVAVAHAASVRAPWA